MMTAFDQFNCVTYYTAVLNFPPFMFATLLFITLFNPSITLSVSILQDTITHGSIQWGACISKQSLGERRKGEIHCRVFVPSFCMCCCRDTCRNSCNRPGVGTRTQRVP